MPSDNSLWFPHDFNARNDPRLLSLRGRFGAEGYGIYFLLIEIMHNEDGYLKIEDGVMFDIRAGEDILVQRVVKASLDLGLFKESKDGIYSDRVLENIERRKKLQKAGRKGGKKSKKDKPPLSPPKATPQAVQKRRVEKSREDPLRGVWGEIEKWLKKQSSIKNPTAWINRLRKESDDKSVKKAWSAMKRVNNPNANELWSHAVSHSESK